MLEELRRRNVHRVAIAYLAGAWLLVQIVETLLPAFDWPGQVLRVVLILLAVGFIPALALAWVFEWTPDGLRRETEIPGSIPRPDTRRFDRVVTAILVMAVAYFAIDKFVLDPLRDAAREQEIADRARSEALVASYADRSIVVLPFVNMSDDPQNEFFSDGITEELLNVLAGVRDLRVISRSSSFAFKNKAVKATDVAGQLNVSYVLEGSVRRAGPVVRITAQLIDGRTDTHVWSDTYDRAFELSEVLQVQDEIARLVADDLTVTLAEHDTNPVNPDAYEAELQVRYLLNLYQPQNVEHIEALIGQGLSADPDYAPLLWDKSRLITHKAFWGLITDEERERAHAEVFDRLRVLDPDNATWLLRAATQESNRIEMARLVAEAYNRAPTDVAVVENVARFARVLGQFDTAIALGNYLVDRDPLCGRCYYRLGVTYADAGKFEMAIAAFEKAILLGTGGIDARGALGHTYLALGQARLALEAFAGNEHEVGRRLGRMLSYYDLGDVEKYRELRAAMWDTADWDVRASIAAWTGDADTAFTNLEQGYAENPESMQSLFSNSMFARIQDDPRWDDLMRRLGTRDEDLAQYTLDIRL